MYSKACKSLKETLVANGQRCFRIRPNSRTYKRRPTDLIVYYGGKERVTNVRGTEVNTTRTNAQNKLIAFRKFAEHNVFTVEWTDDPEVAAEWKGKVICRTLLTSHSGKGIIVYEKESGEPLPTAKLYTKYVKKTYECRIHIFKGKMIDAQIKRKVRGNTEADNIIRNHHTGWVYCRDNFVVDPIAIETSIAAVAALGLDFGAVDLIYNQHYNKFYVLEVNTAPGLSGTTLSNYAKEIESCL